MSFKYKENNIKEVLALTIDQAQNFFSNKKIQDRIKSLQEVGLGYMTLGQSTNTFSGGENQRLKLASEIHKKGNIYILDEPSTGLHHSDTERLITLFNQLVNDGNTVIIIEHRLEMIALADWVIDLGPSGGHEGGQVIFSGTPADLMHCNNSVTGHYLKSVVEQTSTK
ncbi:ATP-binding cassette domain-containing protein [Paenibacillus sp. 7516]|uniref:ATP-binding cassette domain-containing protein n=1 Tax=Paenibacillus sp. 7516 TaxID=2022549 RepID=UPI00201697D9|nr:ATP-binding cassette domain-containing protein [Paenibacillus sp. 7516]